MKLIRILTVFLGKSRSFPPSGTTKPINWRKPVYELDTDAENNGFINEDFVWMRTAALPIFCKLYRIIQKNNNVMPTLPQGNYTLDVTYNILSQAAVQMIQLYRKFV